jgi:hypothetical protein
MLYWGTKKVVLSVIKTTTFSRLAHGGGKCLLRGETAGEVQYWTYQVLNFTKT